METGGKKPATEDNTSEGSSRLSSRWLCKRKGIRGLTTYIYIQLYIHKTAKLNQHENETIISTIESTD